MIGILAQHKPKAEGAARVGRDKRIVTAPPSQFTLCIRGWHIAGQYAYADIWIAMIMANNNRDSAVFFRAELNFTL